MSLLSEKNFNDISVIDICEKAMIHRATFYKHFYDKFQLVDTTINEIFNNFTEKPKQEKNFKDIREFFLIILEDALEYINENKKLLKNIITNNKDTIVYFMVMQKSEIFTRKLFTDYNTLLNNEIPDNVLSRFVTSGFISVIYWWLEEDVKYTKEQMLKYFEFIINNFKFLQVLT